MEEYDTPSDTVMATLGADDYDDYGEIFNIGLKKLNDYKKKGPRRKQDGRLYIVG